MPTRLVLIRHGQSVAMVERVAGGDRGCRGLSDLGHRQAAALAARLAATGELADATVLLSSTLPRAVETAEAIRDALGGLPIGLDADLREWHPGEGDGLTWEEWERRFGGFDTAVEPYRPLSPGGESWAEFQLRAGRALARVAAAHPDTTVVVACHGGIIESSLLHGLQLPSQFPPEHRIQIPTPTSLTEWRVTAEPARPLHWQLVRFGDAAHLGADAEPRAARWS